MNGAFLLGKFGEYWWEEWGGGLPLLLGFKCLLLWNFSCCGINGLA